MDWFRVYDTIIDDPKILKLSWEFRWHFVEILCAASRNSERGTLPDMEEVSIHMRVKIGKAQEIVDELVSKGFVDKVDDPPRLVIHGWNKRQYKSDDSYERVKRFRDEERNVSSDVSETPRGGRARSASVSVSVSGIPEEGGAGGNPPAEVGKLAESAEHRWPAECADVFVGDLCKTFDHRLVCQVLNSAYDREPGGKLPRAWIRAGCRNRFNDGWRAETPRLTNGQADHGASSPAGPTGVLPPDIEAKVKAWEAENAKR